MKTVLALTSFLLCAACSSINSSDIKSGGIYAMNSVSATGGSVSCESSLRAGGATGSYVDLEGSDVLYCNDVRMHKEGDVFGQISYRASVPSSPRAIYEIKLVRDGETLRSAAMMPSPITGAAIVGGATQKIGTPVTVTWDKSQFPDESVTASLILSDDHTKKFGGASVTDSSPEIGRATFSASDTEIRIYNEATNGYEHVRGPYSATIQFLRAKSGTVDGAWRGSMGARQTVTLEAKFLD